MGELKVENHVITIFDQEKIEISQAEEILSSTEKEVYVKLQKDILRVSGENLKINKLIPESQTMSISGKILGVNYMSKMNKKSLFGKVFK